MLGPSLGLCHILRPHHAMAGAQPPSQGPPPHTLVSQVFCCWFLWSPWLTAVSSGCAYFRQKW